jgi:hypothetical protein
MLSLKSQGSHPCTIGDAPLNLLQNFNEIYPLHFFIVVVDQPNMTFVHARFFANF